MIPLEPRAALCDAALCCAVQGAFSAFLPGGRSFILNFSPTFGNFWPTKVLSLPKSKIRYGKIQYDTIRRRGQLGYAGAVVMLTKWTTLLLAFRIPKGGCFLICYSLVCVVSPFRPPGYQVRRHTTLKSAAGTLLVRRTTFEVFTCYMLHVSCHDDNSYVGGDRSPKV